MQRNRVQCFGCRIDNLKCVPICTRSSLQMSVSFLFTWQIAETPKKLLLSFSCSLCNLLFFFFFYVVFYYLLQKSHVDIIGSSKVCLYPTVRRPRILHRLLLRSGGVKNPEQIFFSSLSLCNALFLLMGLPYCSTTLTTGYIIPILEERNWIMGLLPCSYVGILQLKQYFSSGLLQPFPHGHFCHPNMNPFLDPTLAPCPFSPERDQQLHLKENEEK